MKHSKDIVKRAKEIHKRVFTMDTHVDIHLDNFIANKNYSQALETQVNVPFMDDGDLNCVWLVVYTRQGVLNEEGYEKAYKDALNKFDAIHRLCKVYASDQIGLATSSKEVKELHAQGKRVVMIGVENGYPMGTDLSRVKEFYDRGARYMSFSHNGHSQLCDSHTGEENGFWLHNGLSELGKQAVLEMNKWGMMIDVSHPSEKSMKDMIELSKAPIIASHSSARALCGHSRNLDDEQLQLLKENGGVVQVVAFSAYLATEKHNQYTEVSDAEILKLSFEVKPKIEIDQMPSKEMYTYRNTYRLLSDQVVEKARVKRPPVDVVDLVDHIDYIVDKIGIDHVGISSDFDGGGGIYGWNNASETLNVTIELVSRGYTEKEISKLWGGNLFRVMDRVEEVAKEIRAGQSA